MTTPTLDNGAIDLGIVGKPETIVLDNGLFQKSLPGTNSESKLVLDVFGKSRTITIVGTKTGSEATLKTWVEQIDAWANATIQERKTYKSSINKTYSVRCDLFSYSIEQPEKITYKMILIEAGII